MADSSLWQGTMNQRNRLMDLGLFILCGIVVGWGFIMIISKDGNRSGNSGIYFTLLMFFLVSTFLIYKVEPNAGGPRLSRTSELRTDTPYVFEGATQTLDGTSILVVKRIVGLFHDADNVPRTRWARMAIEYPQPYQEIQFEPGDMLLWNPSTKQFVTRLEDELPEQPLPDESSMIPAIR